MKYKAVLFDLDDTLLKTSAVKWAQHKAVAKQFYNIDLTDEVLAKYWGMPFEPMMAIFYQNADTPENMLKANLSLDDQFPKELQNDAVETVNTLLEAGVEIGIVTSIFSYLARKELQGLNFPMEDLFLIQGADDVSRHKPDPRVFDTPLTMLKAKNITSDETLYIGDALIDYYAARDAGMGFVGVTTGLTTKKEFEQEGAHSETSLHKVLEFLDVIPK